MFDSKQTLTTRIVDAADLMIDFATLGEYGLEPVSTTATPCDGARPRPLPIANRESFDQVLFPNRHRGDRRNASPNPVGAPSPASSFPVPCGPRRGFARKRGSRGASGAPSARGAA